MYPHAGESAGLDAPRPTVRGPQSRRAPKWVPQRTADPFDGTDDDDDGLSDSDEGLLQKLGDFSCALPLLLSRLCAINLSTDSWRPASGVSCDAFNGCLARKDTRHDLVDKEHVRS